MVMGLTATEKILNNHRVYPDNEVYAGDYLIAFVDKIMAHEALTRTIDFLGGVDKINVWDSKKLVIFLDHWAPAPTIEVANMHIKIRKFVKEKKIQNFFDVNSGICHQIMIEKNLVKPGELVIGTDSHTITYGAVGALSTAIGPIDLIAFLEAGKNWFKVPKTIVFEIDGKPPKFILGKDISLYLLSKYGESLAIYKTIEYRGEAIKNLSIDSRLTLANMSVEMGAKFSFIEPDEKTLNYINSKEVKNIVKSDPDAPFEKIFYEDVTDLPPYVAAPHRPSNGAPIDNFVGVKLDMVFVGSCTNGRYEDLFWLAKILKNKKVHKDVRLIVTPASRDMYLRALKDGLIEIIVKAGGIVTNSTCGACIGGHLGVLGDEEVALSTTSRNLRGRMGSMSSKVYLASPIVAAVSAIKGEITDPREFNL